MARASVVLPEPDSPTRAKVSPAARLRDTPATASIHRGPPLLKAASPPPTEKRTTRSSTSSSAVMGVGMPDNSAPLPPLRWAAGAAAPCGRARRPKDSGRQRRSPAAGSQGQADRREWWTGGWCAPAPRQDRRQATAEYRD